MKTKTANLTGTALDTAQSVRDALTEAVQRLREKDTGRRLTKDFVVQECVAAVEAIIKEIPQ